MDETLKNSPAEERKWTEEELIAKKIYDKCVELNLSEIKTREAKQKLTAVCAGFGVSGKPRELKRVYAFGAEVAKEMLYRKNQEQLALARSREQGYFDADREAAALIGREKYLAKRPNRQAERNSIALPYNTRGFVSAAERDIDNACLVAAAANARRQAHVVEKILNNGKTAIERETEIMINEHQGVGISQAELREHIATRLVDFEARFETEEYPELVNLKCLVTKGRNFLVQGEVSAPEVVSLLGRRAILDGTYQLSVVDEKGIVVAEGFFVAPGIGETDLNVVGLVDGYTFQSLCLSENPEAIHPNGTYECVATPAAFWAIEL